MGSGYIQGLQGKTVIYELIDQGKYEDALNVAYTRYNATGLLYELPPIICLRRKIYGLEDAEAKKLEAKLLKFGSDDDIAKLANTSFLLEQYEESLEAYLRILESTRFNDCYPYILKIYHLLGQDDKATEFERTWKYDIEEVKTELNEILARRTIVPTEETRKDLEALLAKCPGYITAIYELGRTLLVMGEYDEAEATFEKVKASARTYDEEYNSVYNIAMCKYSRGEVIEAESYLKMLAIDLIDNNELKGKILLLLSTINGSLGRFQVQISYLEELVKINPSVDFYLKLSQLYKKVNNISAAKQSLLMALELEEEPYKKADICYNLIGVCLKEGKITQATKYLKDCTSVIEYYSAKEDELLKFEAYIEILTDREPEGYKYLISQLREYSKDAAINHIRIHENDEVSYRKEIHTVFESTIDIEVLYDEVSEAIKGKIPEYFDICDIYVVEMPFVTSVIDGYPTKKVRVITAMNKKDIITMYPLALTEDEKKKYDEQTKPTEKPRMSALDKFNMRYGKK